MSENELLLDIEVFPDYGQIEVSDVVGRDMPESYGQTVGAVFTDHTVDVFTMSVDQAVNNDKNVRVRVYRGGDTTEMGALVFGRPIEFTNPPRLGVYQPLTDEPEDGGGSVPIERTGPVHIQIFATRPQKPRKSTSSSATTYKAVGSDWRPLVPVRPQATDVAGADVRG